MSDIYLSTKTQKKKEKSRGWSFVVCNIPLYMCVQNQFVLIHSDYWLLTTDFRFPVDSQIVLNEINDFMLQKRNFECILDGVF